MIPTLINGEYKLSIHKLIHYLIMASQAQMDLSELLVIKCPLESVKLYSQEPMISMEEEELIILYKL